MIISVTSVEHYSSHIKYCVKDNNFKHIIDNIVLKAMTLDIKDTLKLKSQRLVCSVN